MSITAEHDAQIGALYVRLQSPESTPPVASTVEAMGFVVDLDADGQPIGFEVTAPRTSTEIAGMVDRFGLLDRLGSIQKAIEAALAPQTGYRGVAPVHMTVTTVISERDVASGSISLGVPPRDLQLA